MKAIIYKPAKNVMQSGRGKADIWVLEADASIIRRPESLNGWTSANTTSGQVQVKFESLEMAEKFAEDNQISYYVKTSSERKVRPRNYGDNFKYIPFEETSK